MYAFHVFVHGAGAGGAVALANSFDAASAALAELPRMFIEPDGSFVWAGAAEDGSAWQVDGNLIDQGASLAYAELKGCCPVKRFDELLQALGWPEQPLLFQLPTAGAFLNEAELRQLLRTCK